ncbi:MAG: hypothetical protein JSS70_15305 [Bacteroidetes bacterium]|nr:hypothetical protein [Bacteroidota bacterium]
MYKIYFILLCILATVGAFAQTQPTTGSATTGKPVVAIYPFTVNRGYNYEYAEGVGDAVEAGVVRSGRFTVVERNRFGVIKEENRFQEANTSDIVKKAAKLGAKTIITGNIVGVSKGKYKDSYGQTVPGSEYVEISLSFKIIDVETGEIKKSEIISGKGEEHTETAAIQSAYMQIDKLLRAQVANYLPQRFKFMEVVSKGTTRKKGDYLNTFKIWGGSDNGLKAGDALELYQLSYVENPDTHKKIEEKKLLGRANVTEINSGSTATCSVIDGSKIGNDLLQIVQSQPTSIVIEFVGNWYEKRTLLDVLLKD